MEKLFHVDWPFSVQTEDNEWNKPLNNIDCMRIYFKQEELSFVLIREVLFHVEITT